MVLLLRSTKKICNKSRRIYIPIWCYFYSAFGVAVPEFHQFTFQYGATSTIAAISSVSATFLFTFQYGATSTIYNHIFYCTLYDLHSNMVLLLLVDYRYIRPYLRNLHSNMVLLLRLAYLQKEGENEDLHSNMVLLLLVQEVYITLADKYLHSNMVLLLPN